MERHEKWKLSECNQCSERNVNIKSINKHKGDTENRDTKCDICGKRYTNMIWEDMREVNIEENKLSVTSVVREIMIVAVLVNMKE